MQDCSQHIMVVRLDSEFQFEQYLHWFDEEVQQKILRYHFRIDRLRAFTSELLKRYYLAKSLSISLGEINIAYNDLGKPMLMNAQLQHISFSISHSGDYVVLAVSSNQRVGVDIEKIDEKIVPSELGKLVFSASENHLIADDVDKFFLLWTKKEALFKARGTGFINDYYLNTSLTTDLHDNVVDYQIYSQKFAIDYYLSICYC